MKKQDVNIEKLELLITIVNRNKGEFFADFISTFESNLQMHIYGEGTANSEIMSMLGLTDLKKDIILSVVTKTKLKEILPKLEDKFKTIKGGKGIAFSIPLSSVIGANLYGFLSNNKLLVKEKSTNGKQISSNFLHS